MLYRSLLRPILFRLPPETAHELALQSLAFLKPKSVNRLVQRRLSTKPFGELTRFGLKFSNPVGLAAGFDKDGIALQPLAALGFGFIEAGTVTYQAQPGNPRPRLFRLAKDNALINRAGFNNAGAAAFAERVSRIKLDCVLGVSIGKSKITAIEDATNDYLTSFELVYPVADYVAINVSSPNTPQLRELQKPSQLSSLLTALQMRNQELQQKYSRRSPMPLLVKLSPDIEEPDIERIVNVINPHVGGIIATNTTIKRDNLLTDAGTIAQIGEGGLSGAPLRQTATQMIAKLYRLTEGKVPLIGVGGIFTAEDAWEKIAAGASLVQLYTGFIYQGPSIAKDINEGLARLLTANGLTTLDEAVGHRAKELEG
ncbi:MAG TPA: quinone-dependent dihydroorotate dehydrogenase [Pyrinomonadaceae bacterium]|nr:quinone-dependent dihydroorotate dehydrogenase [Pyrinomonadaceae bacterium]